MDFMAEINHLFGFESIGIVSDDLLRAAKSGQDIALKELDNDSVIGLPTGNGFNPLSEIVGGC